MALDHRTKLYGVKEVRVVKLVTDVPGAACTYSGVTTAVVASPAPTVTTFSVTAATGSTLTVGRVINIGAQIGVISAIATDAITVSPALPVAPSTADVVFMPTSYPITGAKMLSVTPTVKTVDLRGDNTFYDTDTTFQSLAAELDAAKISFDVMSLMVGGTITDTGTTPNQQTKWSLLKQPIFNYFRVEARCYTIDSPNGDVHIIFNKVKASDVPLFGFAEEDYHVPKFKFKSVPPVGTTNWIDTVMNETGLPVA